MNIKSVCVPLDPDDCGSTISGYVRYPEILQRDYGDRKWYINYTASVSLSDCSRVIQWGLSDGGNYNIEKLDRAISALSKLREYCVAANVELVKLRKEKKVRNLALNPNDSNPED
jgi:hypothetical protein